jgi:hypothetical protein
MNWERTVWGWLQRKEFEHFALSFEFGGNHYYTIWIVFGGQSCGENFLKFNFEKGCPKIMQWIVDFWKKTNISWRTEGKHRKTPNYFSGRKVIYFV